jgi:5-methyltetrahydrofolate--homocysteine methyltransferase
MVRELAELVDLQVAVLRGAWRTMVQPRQISAAAYRRDGHHRNTAGDLDLLNLTRPTSRFAPEDTIFGPGAWPWPPGPPSITGYAKTLIESASRKKP